MQNLGKIETDESHVIQLHPGVNIDPTGPPPQILIGDGYLWDAVFNYIDKNGIKLTSQTGVAKEILFSAGVLYFQKKGTSGSGWREWDYDRVNAWVDATLAFIDAEFGDAAVYAVLHLNEKTPHIHLYHVPTVEHRPVPYKLKRKKKESKEDYLARAAVHVPKKRAKRFKEGELKLSLSAFWNRRYGQLQDRIMEFYGPLGIERGEKGSTATHTRLKEAGTVLQQQVDEYARLTDELKKEQANLEDTIAKNVQAAYDDKVNKDLAPLLSNAVQAKEEAKEAKEAAEKAKKEAEEAKKAAEREKEEYRLLCDRLRSVTPELILAHFPGFRMSGVFPESVTKAFVRSSSKGREAVYQEGDDWYYAINKERIKVANGIDLWVALLGVKPSEAILDMSHALTVKPKLDQSKGRGNLGL